MIPNQPRGAGMRRSHCESSVLALQRLDQLQGEHMARQPCHPSFLYSGPHSSCGTITTCINHYMHLGFGPECTQDLPGGDNVSPLGIFWRTHPRISQKRNPETFLAESIFEICVYLPVDYLKMGNALMEVNGLFAQKSPTN